MTELINKKYDLEERTGKFGEDVIQLCKFTRITFITRQIIDQLIRSATSVGANYMEANGASSRKDFKNKIRICLKEAQETKHWLRMFIKADQSNKTMIIELSDECRQLTLIFQKISNKLNDPKNEN